LNHNHNIAPLPLGGLDDFGCFGHTITGAFMCWRCHDCLATECLDSEANFVIAGGDVNVVQNIASCGAAKDVLDHWPPK
jgi:hypothetical protein